MHPGVRELQFQFYHITIFTYSLDSANSVACENLVEVFSFLIIIIFFNQKRHAIFVGSLDLQGTYLCISWLPMVWFNQRRSQDFILGGRTMPIMNSLAHSPFQDFSRSMGAPLNSTIAANMKSKVIKWIIITVELLLQCNAFILWLHITPLTIRDGNI